MLSKSKFLKKYGAEESFKAASENGLSWNTVSGICDDYQNHWYGLYNRKTNELVQLLNKHNPKELLIIYGRAKNPEHIGEKIIRKIGNEGKAKYFDIGIKNYRDIITDLSGVRILILCKEDWIIVDRYIRKRFTNFVEPPVAYVCYGDRHIYDESKMKIDYTNKGYRSIHYLVNFKGMKCEIQVRTLAEEVYGEYDHAIRYPYRMENSFLNRYNRMVSKTASELDDLISVSFSIGDDMLSTLSDRCKNDVYIDWKSKVDEGKADNPRKDALLDLDNNVNARDFARNKLINR